MSTLYVHELPELVHAAELAGRTVVVVDLLRASSTICQALDAGARSVLPLVEVEEARRIAASLPPHERALGGERAGVRIAGFDLGNSPAEYTPQVVDGMRIVFTTTNGAKAIDHARCAARVVVGAILNRQAVVDAICHEPHIDVLCAGTDGHVTREDLLCAGAIADRLLASATRSANATALEAQRDWLSLVEAARRGNRSPEEQLALELRSTEGGRNLLALGMESDLTVCSKLDSLGVVPELDRSTGELRRR